MNKENLRIVYMGTPAFAVPPLDALIEEGYRVVAVVTVADKPAGRGRKLSQSAVKEAALRHELPVLQPTSLKDAHFLSELEALHADLFVVVAFRMLPKAVWAMPKLGTFNLHGSLLPKYRGAAPIQWAVINGDRTTGLTTFLLDEAIDTGGILLQREMSIDPDWTAGDLHDRLMPLGARMVVETVEGLAQNSLVAMPQNSEEASHAPKLFKEDAALDFTQQPAALRQQILGMSPHPGAHAQGYKFLNAVLCEEEVRSEHPVLLRRDKRLILSYPFGSLEITQIVPPGKRPMDGRSFANGLGDRTVVLD